MRSFMYSKGGALCQTDMLSYFGKVGFPLLLKPVNAGGHGDDNAFCDRKGSATAIKDTSKKSKQFVVVMPGEVVGSKGMFTFLEERCLHARLLVPYCFSQPEAEIEAKTEIAFQYYAPPHVDTSRVLLYCLLKRRRS